MIKEPGGSLGLRVAKVAAVVTGLAISAVGLYGLADSHLQIDGGRAPAIDGAKVSDETLYVMAVLFVRVKNTGLRADHIDRIDVHPIHLDEELKGEARFVDRREIPWRCSMELRFEVLVSASRRWHGFTVYLYDSKGREVGQVPVTARVGAPGDIVARHQRMKESAAGTMESLTEAPAPVLVGAVLYIHPDAGATALAAQVVAKIVSESKTVVAVNTPGAVSFEADGTAVCQLRVLSRVLQSDRIGYELYIGPPLGRGLGWVKWRLTWADGSVTEQVIRRPHIDERKDGEAATEVSSGPRSDGGK